MSKKTKRLEKENLSLTRKQEATNKNIFQMAEERSQSQQTIDRLTRENEKLKKLCRAMQTGGYGGAGGGGGGGGVGDGEMGLGEFEGETESEYDDEEDDEEYDEDDEGEFDDDDTEEEEGLEVVQTQQPRAFGPPPPPTPQELPNGGIKGKGIQQQPNGAAVNGTGGRGH